jgi:hypothetical protein
MLKRGYRHHTPLPAALATGDSVQDEHIHTPEEQIRILQKKGCDCFSCDKQYS